MNRGRYYEEMNESYVKKAARWVLRQQNQINYKYWHKLRRGRRHIKWVAYVPVCCFLLFAFVYTAVGGSEKLLGMNMEDRGVLNYLVIPAEWLTKIMSSESIVSGVEVGLSWFFGSSILIFIVKFALWLIPLTLLYLAVWWIADVIVNGKQHRDEERIELLQQALRPIPSRSQIASRFFIVLLIVWFGLRSAEQVARHNGICLLATNNQCEYDMLNDIIWLILAVVAATVSIKKMYRSRVDRDIAKKKLVNMRKPFVMGLKRWSRVIVWSVVVLLVWFWMVLFVFN